MFLDFFLVFISITRLEGLKRVLHFFVVFTLSMKEFGHAQISVSKIIIPML